MSTVSLLVVAAVAAAAAAVPIVNCTHGGSFLRSIASDILTYDNHLK